MAISKEHGSVTFFGFKMHIEAIQSVMPVKQTYPRQTFRVLVPETPNNSGDLQRRFQIVMCHKALEEEEEENSGWATAGWIKESLGRALAEQPVFAGRLRRGEDGDGELEIITNDSGARLVEASVDVDLDEFLGLKEKQEAEAQLVFWDNISEHNPEFFPLFYVQITNFKCGGFSIGISCSLLVADPFSMLSFLDRWSEIHKKLVSSIKKPKLPIFYLPYLRKTGHYPSIKIDPKARAKAGKSLIFGPGTKIVDLDNKFMKNVAAECLAEAEQKLGRKMVSNFSLFLKEASGDVKIEKCTRETVDQKPTRDRSEIINSADSDDQFAVGKGHLIERSLATYVSSWINSVCDEGFVMISPASQIDGLGLKVVVTTPN